MPSRIHSLLPQMAIGVAVLVLVGLPFVLYHRFAHTYSIPLGADVFEAVTGRWTVAGPGGDCDTNAITVGFTPDHADMILVRSHPVHEPDGTVDSVSRYPVLGHTLHSIQVVRRGERLLNADSTPVVWTLVLRSPDTYAWHRSDWLPLRFAPDLRRCPSS